MSSSDSDPDFNSYIALKEKEYVITTEGIRAILSLKKVLNDYDIPVKINHELPKPKLTIYKKSYPIGSILSSFPPNDNMYYIITKVCGKQIPDWFYKENGDNERYVEFINYSDDVKYKDL